MLEQARVVEANDACAVAAEAAARTPRLLVIDDDHLHCMIICRIAAKAGFAALAAASYEEAAKLTQEATFDCITLDLSLGAHAGVEMLRHLWVLRCKAPIIIITGCDDAVCRETLRVGKSLNLNVWEPVPKPVDLAMLRCSLERLRAELENAAADA